MDILPSYLIEFTMITLLNMLQLLADCIGSLAGLNECIVMHIM